MSDNFRSAADNDSLQNHSLAFNRI